MNGYFLAAALASLVAAVVHGAYLHRAMLTPLAPNRLFPTPPFGDADMSRRILVVAWHQVTAALACSAVAMCLLAFGAIASAPLPLFVGAVHAGFLLVAFVVVGARFGELVRPVPLAFVASMSTVSVMAWLGSR